jgi:hypothetical protein
MRGVPVLIDPQTYFLQDRQHPADPWASLPFGTAEALTASDLSDPAEVDGLIETCVTYQLDHGATQLVAPYVHVEKGYEAWADVQALIHRRLRRYIDRNALGFKIVAPVALSWSLLPVTRRASAFDVIVEGLQDLAPDEVALAASKADEGVRAWERTFDFASAISVLADVAPVIAWQQGALGELAVAAGAIGYETGIGWRERCKLREAAAAHRQPAVPAPIGARPTYVQRLMRSLPRPTLAAAVQHPALVAELTCLNGDCCPEGRSALTHDAREHSVLARARSLQGLASIDSPRWRWHDLEERATRGLALARRLNLLADRDDRAKHVDQRGLEAIQVVAHAQQRRAPRRAA